MRLRETLVYGEFAAHVCLPCPNMSLATFEPAVVLGAPLNVPWHNRIIEVRHGTEERTSGDVLRSKRKKQAKKRDASSHDGERKRKGRENGGRFSDLCIIYLASYNAGLLCLFIYFYFSVM